MNYYELLFTTITSEDYQQDLLINALGEIGFDTFEELDFGFKAYIPTADFNQLLLQETLASFREMFSFSYDTVLIPQKNWNEVWESNFEPITIGNKIFVRATFHEPKAEFPYEIVIDPKMAFGTGHHQTTSMMLQYILDIDFSDKNVLDMGCGTGILAIMASKLGAKQVTAIDYDSVCIESTLENAQLNQISNIETLCGSKEVIPEIKYDIILANINRNILLDQLKNFSHALLNGGELFLSGFYKEPDLEIIKSEAFINGLQYLNFKEDSNWVAAKFILSEE